MMLRVVCSQCAREIFALPQSAGKVGQCSCGEQLAIPAAAPAPTRRPLSTRATTLLIAAGVGAGLAAGLLPGKRSTAAPQPAPTARAEGAGPANEGGPPASYLASSPGGAAAALPLAAELPQALPSPPTPSSPALSARELFRLYQEDAAGADALYRGRTVRVRGQLVHPQPDRVGDGVAGLVTFGTEEMPVVAYPQPLPPREGIFLHIGPSSRAEFRALDSGAAVMVEGRCAGRRPDPSAHLGAVVVLEDCHLIPAPKH